MKPNKRMPLIGVICVILTLTTVAVVLNYNNKNSADPTIQIESEQSIEILSSNNNIEQSTTQLQIIETETSVQKSMNINEDTSICNNYIYSADKFKVMGVVNWNGYKWTWYSQKVLPGRGLKIPGRHVDENGYVCDENDYICLASSTLPYGTIINTPFGKQGKVYDCGCPVGTVDVYVDF